MKRVKKRLSCLLFTAVLCVLISGIRIESRGEDTPAEIIFEIDGDALAQFELEHPANRTLDESEAKSLLMKVGDILGNTELSEEERDYYLSLLDSYRYSVPASVRYASSSPSDVYLRTPSITYSSAVQTWTISSTGSWSSPSYNSEKPASVLLASAGQSVACGGLDTIGILLFDITSGSNSGPVLLQYGEGGFENGGARYYSGTLVTANDSKGGAFLIQDKFYVVSNTLLNPVTEYNAQSLDCRLYYKGLSNYHGKMRLMYGHTWNTTSINSIGIGIDSFSISWTTSGNYWPSYSYASNF